ncbi:MAG: tetratricopeptide repeat protein [Kiritimatiellales bacterium]|nr:tetratricopeptide repeat protein [Kiritimatiellales bacterium]
MKKKRKEKSSTRAGSGFDNLSTSGDLYASAPTEKPLYDVTGASDSRHVRRTSRHHVHKGRETQTDPREKAALISILKSTVMILLLIIAFFLLKTGVGIYEDSVALKYMTPMAPSPVMQEVVPIADLAIEDGTVKGQFAERIRLWSEAERHIRAADALLERNILKQAIERCQEALTLDHSHSGALERLGDLYFREGNYIASVNALIRLLSIDPAKPAVQKKLLQSLVALEDWKSVIKMAEWYMGQNDADRDIQEYLGKALCAENQLEKAVSIYASILRTDPEHAPTLKRLGEIYMSIGQYEQAVIPYTKLRETDYKEADYYRQLAICYAHLHQATDAVNVLGRAAQIFGDAVVIGWVKDPLMDVVREDRVFQGFTDRIAGQETRKWLEQMARNIKDEKTKAPEVPAQLLEIKEITPKK